MLIPRFWAEARQQRIVNGRQWTIRRWGWSDEALSAAQAKAEARVEEAFLEVTSGMKPWRRERKVPYNGANGVPIREEVIARYDESVVTRNSYGSLCLNTPDVLFVDMDLNDGTPWKWFVRVGFATAFLALAIQIMFPGAYLIWLVVLFVPASITSRLYRFFLRLKGGHRGIAMARIRQFSKEHPDWNLRVYETPLGYRVLAMHTTFDPHGHDVTQCFDTLGCDPVYVAMCRFQRCFRARVSPKPWRVGLPTPMLPRGAVWPLTPEKMEVRQSWIQAYEQRSADYAACRFVAHLGSDRVHPSAEAVRRWHDELSRAESGLPIA
jgi:hypothetical protein